MCWDRRAGSRRPPAVNLRRLAPPFPWQASALEIWLRSCRGIIAAVTGAGKTTFALHCVDAWLRQTPNGAVCIVVPTVALLDQWFVTLNEDFQLPETEISLCGGGSRPTGPSRFIISVINSARTWSEAVFRPGPRMLIVDECHRAGSPENAKALSGTWSATLGLSATPDRDYDDGFYQFVAPVLGEIIYKYDYVSAYRDGVIVPFGLINVHFDMSPEEEAEYNRLSRLIAVKSRSDGSEADEGLEALLRRRARVSWNSTLRVPLAARLAIDNRHRKVVIFHESVKSADQIHAILERRGIMATLYHTGLPPLRRHENLRQFRRGFYSCLVCCRALDEGLNVPGASVAVVASGTSSVRQRIQRLGRVLRRHDGKDDALIYTLFATAVEKTRLEREEAKLSGVASVQWLHAGVPGG